MSTLFLGTPTDPPTQRVFEALTKRHGKTGMVLDTTLFPSHLQVSFPPTIDRQTEAFLSLAIGEVFSLAEVSSVFLRWNRGVERPEENDPTLQEIVYWNLEATMGGLLRCLSHAKWVNTLQAHEEIKYKPDQLRKLIEAGIRVPDTVFTNHPDTVKAFYERYPEKSIFKAVRGWAHTEPLTKEKLAPEVLAKLTFSPVQLQERIEGQDIRIYVVGEQIFAMAIDSEALDFREDYEAKRIPLTLPESVQKDCLKICKTLGLVYTGIDCRHTPQGEYVFFEANASPMYVYDEAVSGYPITDALVEYLIC